MIKLLTQLRIILPPQKKRIAVLLILFMVFIALLELVGVTMLMPVVSVFANPNSLHTNGVTSFLNNLFHTETPHQFIAVCAILMILFYIMKNMLSWLLVRLQSSFCISVADNLAGRLYTKYTTLPGENYSQQQMSVFIIRLNQVYEITQELIFPILIASSEFCVFLFLGCAVFILNPLVTVAVIVAGAVTFFLFYLPIKKKMEHSGQTYRQSMEAMQASLTETFSQPEFIRVTGTESFFRNRFSAIRQKRLDAQKTAANIGQLPRLAMEVFGILLTMGTVILVLMTTGDFAESATVISFFIAVFVRMMPGVSRIQYNLLHIRFGQALFEQLYGDLQNLPEQQLSQGEETEKTVLTAQKQISLEHIHFSYANNPPVFTDLNRIINIGQITAITGKTGCGKTTLLHLLTGFYHPTIGTICSDGTDILKNLRAWQNLIGYMPQEIHLLNDTIEANIAFGVPQGERDVKHIEECLKMAEIWDFTTSLPDGLQTCVGEDGNRLSGGQRQRLALARALYNRPQIILLDEPTAALDKDTEKAIAQSLKKLRENKTTVIIITHSKELLPFCDQVLPLD